ncbi:hypothetical protein WJX81_002087 [Elliptochloris bilobata]|uniref:Coenzyme Q-binding protein COQ10 START domain-containing protein n=1 Tax=Elliptochloris bilobata TaxID=381761 RepID=A0AAW1RGL0_9CHLO
MPVNKTAMEFVDVQDGQFTVEGCLVTPVAPQLVWEVLTDYEGLARTYSTVLESHSRLINKQRHVLQKCRWEFLAFSGSFDTQLAVSEEAAAGRLVFRQLQSSFMRNFEGRWQVDALPAGGCTARHTLSVTPILSPPAILEGPTRSMFASQVERLLADLEAELARRYPQAGN